MVTVFVRGSHRVVVNTNDHPPAHVHVVGPDLDARFKLNAPDGPVTFWDQVGRRRLRPAEINEIGEAIADALADCLAKWREIHG